MSDTRRVENDTKSGEVVMRALLDTEGKTAPERAEFLLQELAKAAHRGRHDTWTAARDRAAEDADVSRTIAKRIWQRWQSMQDVSGEVLLKLMLAYENLCERNEAAADRKKAEWLEMRKSRHEANRGPAQAGGVDHHGRN